MTIELDEESEKRLKEIQKLPTHKHLSLTWLAERAILRYYDKNMDEAQYATYRRKMIRRRLSYQSYLCYWPWCKKPITVAEATLDHLTPKDRGGSSEGSNLVVCCEPCNFEKGDMTESEFLIYGEHRYGTKRVAG